MTVGSLINYLKAQSEKGTLGVYLDTSAREAIRAEVMRHKKEKKASPSRVSSPSLPDTRDESATTRRRSTVTTSRNQVEPKPSSPVVIAPESVLLEIPVGGKQEQIKYLKEQAQDWPPAKSLGSFRSKMVFSVGSPESSLVLIGDSPGFEEELKQEPFVGRGGQKLNAILKAMGLSRRELYITNLCKYRPSLPGQTTNNRKPNAQEIASFLPLFKKELEVIKPKCLLVLGAPAGEALTGQTNAPVGRMRGEWYEFEGIPLRVTYHPTHLLKNENNISEKRKLWEDMLAVMEQLKMPISEKQHGYFLKK